MDDRFRALERRFQSGDESVAEALRAARKRGAQHWAGDFVRLDASRLEGVDVELTGNWEVVMTRTEPEGRSYFIARIVEDSRRDYRLTRTVSEDELSALRVAADAPLAWSGEPVAWLRCSGCNAAPGHPCITRAGVVRAGLHTARTGSIEPCPAPIHTQVIARSRATQLDGRVSARPRVRRTRRPDLTVDVPSVNLDLGIFIRPKPSHRNQDDALTVGSESAILPSPQED